MIVVLLNMGVLTVISVWQNGIQSVKLSDFEFQYFLSGIALLLLFAMLFSTFPAFIGGVFLAWLLKRNKPNWSSMLHGKLRLGLLVGALAGIILALLVLVPADFVSRTAHNGFGYNVYSSIAIYLFYSCEIVFVASAAGAWTDSQLRKQLGNS